MSDKLAGKVALITGGNSGIGQATARLFSQEGAIVIIAARNADKGTAVVAEIESQGGQALFLACDVRQAADCQHVVDKTIEQFGQLDILFNNAGIVPLGTVPETSLDTWQAVWETNVSGTFYASRAALPHMIERGSGVIINNASDVGVVGARSIAVYSTTKGAIVQLTKSMALDHARQGIRVNAVCPGDTYVERWDARLSEALTKEDYLQGLGDVLPMGRVGTVEEIAKGVLFLASDDSSYMTGQLLVLDGGNTVGGTSQRFE